MNLKGLERQVEHDRVETGAAGAGVTSLAGSDRLSPAESVAEIDSGLRQSLSPSPSTVGQGPSHCHRDGCQCQCRGTRTRLSLGLPLTRKFKFPRRGPRPSRRHGCRRPGGPLQVVERVGLAFVWLSHRRRLSVWAGHAEQGTRRTPAELISSLGTGVRLENQS